jgi:hypothetical protein
MLSRPARTGYNLSSIGYPTVSAIADCVVQEVNPQGRLVWQWRASQHVGPGETIPALMGLTVANGIESVDVHHCNSIDVDPVSENDVLVSMCNVGVFLVDKSTGAIIWKLGGTAMHPMDGEPVPTIANDPESTISGQHDARFQPGGDITLFDDRTRAASSARAIEYAIDPVSRVATMVWEYLDPARTWISVMGSVRVYDSNQVTHHEAGTGYTGPNETIVDGGRGTRHGGFVVLDNANRILMNVAYQSGYAGYRAEMVPTGALDLTELRDSAGTRLPPLAVG